MQVAAMTGGVNISFFSCAQGLIQDLNLGSNMNVSSCRPWCQPISSCVSCVSFCVHDIISEY